jgi:hypothetical protein|tara:strand:+ start:2629 stop:2895 length:267 start_codon:yes stop_codon:yes gene_type:complete
MNNGADKAADLIQSQEQLIAKLEATIDVMVTKASAKHRPAYDAQQQRIADLEAGLKYIAAQKDVIGWVPAAHTAQSVLAQQPAEEKGE